MSIWHRFAAIALTCALVGACATFDNGVEAGSTEALLQHERLKFQVVLAGAGRGPWLERDHDNYLYAISYSDAAVRQAFDYALSNEILAKNIGKIVICDCEGHFTDGEKGQEFEISSFTIHFEDASPQLRQDYGDTLLNPQLSLPVKARPDPDRAP